MNQRKRTKSEQEKEAEKQHMEYIQYAADHEMMRGWREYKRDN